MFYGNIHSLTLSSISLFLSSVGSRCPSCQQPISKDDIINDKELQKEIQNFEVYCTNKNKGCDWDGILRDLSTHLETCGFISIDCPNGCGVKYERRFTNKHQKDDCAKRMAVCEFCKMQNLNIHSREICLIHSGKNNIVFEEEIPHLNVCPQFKIPCPNRCSNLQYSREQVTNKNFFSLLTLF